MTFLKLHKKFQLFSNICMLKVPKLLASHPQVAQTCHPEYCWLNNGNTGNKGIKEELFVCLDLLIQFW